MEYLESKILEVQRIVSMYFFWDDHLSQAISRRSFPSSYSWIKSRLLLNTGDSRVISQYSHDEDERQDAARALKNVKRLRDYEVFPVKGE